MQFYTWMRKNYKGEDSDRGDLFEDMESDKAFPRNPRPGKYDGWYRIIRSHLVARHACKEAMSVFNECWRDYVRQEVNKQKQ